MKWTTSLQNLKNNPLLTGNKERTWYITISLVALLAISLVINLVNNVNDSIALQQSSHDRLERIHTLSASTKVAMKPGNIASFHLFTDGINAKNENITSNLYLLGIQYEVDPKVAKAIIQKENGEENIYRTGEQITSGTKVKRIEADKVYLETAGIESVLVLKWEDNSPTSASNIASTPKPTPQSTEEALYKELKEANNL